MSSPGPGDDTERLICNRCGARVWGSPSGHRACADCGGAFRPMGLLEGIVDRWFAPPAQRVAEFYPRHLKLIELMWTSGGRGREMYDALDPARLSYSQFVVRATEMVVRGLAEGWVEARIPAAPTYDDGEYGIRFTDPDRWADALTSEFLGASDPNDVASDVQVRIDVEGDPDAA